VKYTAVTNSCTELAGKPGRRVGTSRGQTSIPFPQLLTTVSREGQRGGGAKDGEGSAGNPVTHTSPELVGKQGKKGGASRGRTANRVRQLLTTVSGDTQSPGQGKDSAESAGTPVPQIAATLKQLGLSLNEMNLSAAALSNVREFLLKQGFSPEQAARVLGRSTSERGDILVDTPATAVLASADAHEAGSRKLLISREQRPQLEGLLASLKVPPETIAPLTQQAQTSTGDIDVARLTTGLQSLFPELKSVDLVDLLTSHGISMKEQGALPLNDQGQATPSIGAARNGTAAPQMDHEQRLELASRLRQEGVLPEQVKSLLERLPARTRGNDSTTSSPRFSGEIKNRLTSAPQLTAKLAAASPAGNKQLPRPPLTKGDAGATVIKSSPSGKSENDQPAETLRSSVTTDAADNGREGMSRWLLSKPQPPFGGTHQQSVSDGVPRQDLAATDSAHAGQATTGQQQPGETENDQAAEALRSSVTTDAGDNGREGMIRWLLSKFQPSFGGTRPQSARDGVPRQESAATDSGHGEPATIGQKQAEGEKPLTGIASPHPGAGGEKTPRSSLPSGQAALPSDSNGEPVSSRGPLLAALGVVGTEGSPRPATGPSSLPAPAAMSTQNADLEPYLQLGQRLVNMTTTGEYLTKLDLHPPDLGRVNVEIRLEDSRLKVALVTENPGVKQLLETHIQELRQHLSQNNLHLEQFRVTVAPDFSAFQQSHQERLWGEKAGGQTDKAVAATTVVEGPEEIAPRQGLSSKDHQIDLFA
jgi:flagellar hook-length control protein FliK